MAVAAQGALLHISPQRTAAHRQESTELMFLPSNKNVTEFRTQSVKHDGVEGETRTGHVACLYDSTTMITHGGSSDKICSLDLRSKSWETLLIVSPKTNLSWARSALVGRNLYIFGGYDHQNQSDQLYKFHIPSCTWQIIPQKGPCKRNSCCMEPLLFPNGSVKLVIFGGYDGIHWLNDTWLFDIELSHFEHVFDTGQVNQRTSFASTHTSNRLYVHGGTGNNAAVLYDDISMFDSATRKWNPVESYGEHAPSKRHSHMAVMADEYRMFVYGGIDGSGTKNDLWEFNLLTCMWHEFTIEDTSPTVYDAVLLYVPMGHLLLYGGGSTGNVYSFEVGRSVRCSHLHDNLWKTIIRAQFTDVTFTFASN